MAALRERKIIRYVKRVTDDIDSVDGSLDMNTMRFNARSGTAKIAGVTISGRVPNVFTFKRGAEVVVCTSTCSVCCACDGTQLISLPTAYMTAEEIGEYISHKYDHFWINPRDPGIVIKLDRATGHTLITLDSTKVKENRIGCISIDFGVSQLGELLGFIGDKSLVKVDPHTNTTFTSPAPARINWLGDTFDIIINGLCISNVTYNQGCPANLFGVVTIMGSKSSDSVVRAYDFTHVINDRPSSQLTFQFISHARPTLPLLLMHGDICIDLIIEDL